MVKRVQRIPKRNEGSEANTNGIICMIHCFVAIFHLWAIYTLLGKTLDRKQSVQGFYLIREIFCYVTKVALCILEL